MFIQWYRHYILAYAHVWVCSVITLNPICSMACPVPDRVTHLASPHRAITANATIATVLLFSLSLIVGQAPIVAASDPSLTNDQCTTLANQTSATELWDLLDEWAIAPQENRIAADLTSLVWIGNTGAYFSATVRRDQVEQVVCQSAPFDDGAADAGEPNVLCEKITLDMDLEDIQQALGSPGEALIGEDGFPLSLVRQWTDPETQQVALVGFSNFGEITGLSCFNP